MTAPTLRERLVRALARTVYRDDNPPPHIARICEPWADEIARDMQTWAAEQTQRAERERDFVLETMPALDTHVVLFDPDTDPCVDWCPKCLNERAEQAEAAVQRVRRMARVWADAPDGDVLAAAGRQILAALDRPEGT